MSLLAKTLQRPATAGGTFDLRAMAPNSSIVRLSRVACWSRKEPVPAAQAVFMEKSSILVPPPSSCPRTMSLASSPPISMMVLAPGWNAPTKAA